MKNNEAELIYHDADYEIVSYGTFVKCAITGEEIDLEDLKYWDVKKQEAYKDCEASLRSKLAAL